MRPKTTIMFGIIHKNAVVLHDSKYPAIHTNNVPAAINILGNKCGSSILRTRWVFNEETTFQEEKEINTNIFKLRVDDPDFNGGDGF